MYITMNWKSCKFLFDKDSAKDSDLPSIDEEIAQIFPDRPSSPSDSQDDAPPAKKVSDVYQRRFVVVWYCLVMDLENRE